MKRTSPLRLQLEEQKSRGRKGSNVRRKRPGEEELVLVGLAAWDRCPSAPQPNCRLLHAPYLSKKNVNALVPTTPHICISVMS